MDLRKVVGAGQQQQQDKKKPTPASSGKGKVNGAVQQRENKQSSDGAREKADVVKGKVKSIVQTADIVKEQSSVDECKVKQIDAPEKVTGALKFRRLRDVTKDMEALMLSRQDDPFLQNLASRDTLDVAEDDFSDDSTSLIDCLRGSKRNVDSEGLSLSDVHEHMIRSPPPIMLPARGAGSGAKMFQFPPGTDRDVRRPAVVRRGTPNRLP